MISSQPIYILHYWKKSCSKKPTTPLRSAIATGLVNCLSGEECLQLIVSRAEIDERLRERLIGRLFESVANGPQKFSEEVLQTILDALATTPYPQKTTLAYFLERLYWSMPSKGRRTILKTFLNSPKRGMRRRAYKLMREDWSSFCKLHLKRRWKQWHEPESALMIVDRFEAAFLAKYIDQLAADLNDGAYISRLYIRACEAEPSLWKKLKKIDGITYAYVAARLGKTLRKATARQLIQEYEYDSRLGILAWSLGKLGHWQLLTELANNIDLLEKKRRRRQFENYGMDSDLIRKLLDQNATQSLPAPPPLAKPS
jgi:hypothetical protein